MIRLAITSDLHIGDHLQFSEIDSNGISSRLKSYLTLAEDFKSFAKESRADACVIAGDLVEQSLLRPCILDVLREVIYSIAKSFPLLLIHGNHDLDSKTNTIARHHSALTNLLGHRNVIYSPGLPSTTKINGATITMVPWNFEVPNGSSDIFIGHGTVKGSANYEGYKFNSGFNKRDLLSKFRLSIVGDIHNGQVITDDDFSSKILIPGCPIQNSYRDAPNTGFWAAEVDGGVNLTFKSIHEIRPNFYHQFLYTDDPQTKSTNLVHYRYKTPKTNGGLGTIYRGTKQVSLLDIGNRIIAEAKIDNKDLIRSKFSEALDNIQSRDKKIPRSKIHSVTIKDFMSIDKFELNLKQFDNLVITGDNGSGKTALFEAIFWCLTGTTTKDMYASDILNDYSSDGIVEVSLTLQIEDAFYRIIRARDNGKPRLTLSNWTDSWNEQDRASVNATQEQIYSLLGLKANEILLLSYFSARAPVLFGTLGASDKNSLMQTVSGTHEVEMLRGYMGQKLASTETELLQIEADKRVNSDLIEQSRERIKKLSSDRDEVSRLSDIQSLKAEEEELQGKIASHFETEAGFNKILDQIGIKVNNALKARMEIEIKVQALETILSRSVTQVETLRGKLKSAISGICPTCGAPLHNPEVENTLKTEMEHILKSLPSEVTIQDEKTKMAELDIKLETLTNQLDSTRKQRDLVGVLNDKLKYVKDMIANLHSKTHEARITVELEISTAARKKLTELSDTSEGIKVHATAEKWLYDQLLKRNGLLVTELNKLTRVLLQEQIDLLIAQEDFRIDIDDKLNVTASFLGRNKGRYERLSTGQERVVDVVMMIALNNLFTKLFGLTEGVLGVVVFDEVLSFLDPRYIDFTYNLLNQADVSRKIVITHDTNLISKFDHRITASLKGKNSSVYWKSWDN